jgi:hypothetical protein
LNEPPKPRQQHRRRRNTFQQIVNGRDAAVGVAGGTVEAEQIARQVAIDLEAGAGDGAGAKRVTIRAGERGLQACDVAFELLDDAQQVVRDRRRLRRLRVRVRGEDALAMLRSEIDQPGAQFDHRRHHCHDELPLPHPVHRHVDVVAAARGMEAARDVFSARFHEQTLDVEEQVLARAVVWRRANVAQGDRVEGIAQRPGVGTADDAALGKHDQVRVVDRHQRREKERLGVLEVFVEDLRDVLRIEPHDPSIAGP